MEQEEINVLHKIIENHCFEKGYSVSEVLGFLTSCLVGTMAMHGFSDQFFDATCERMKVKFREKKNGMD